MDPNADVHRQKVWRWAYTSDVLDAVGAPKGWTREQHADVLDKLSKEPSPNIESTFPVTDGGVPPLARVQPMTLFQEAFAIFLLFLVPGAALWMPVTSLTLIACTWARLLSSWTPVIVYHAALVLVWFIPGPYVPATLSSYGSYCLQRYFSFKAVWANQLDNKVQYVLAAAPHGAFPVGNILSMLVAPSCCGFTFQALAATAALRLPFYRQLMRWIGAVDADRATATALLASGSSLGLNPGGIAEMFFFSKSTNVRVLLKPRKGFIKLAIQHGCTLVPGFAFGNDAALSVTSLPGCARISRFLRTSLVLIWGRWGLPIARRAPIAACMAEPIPCRKIPNPSKEDVDAVHAEFCRGVQHVFDLHKAAYGWPNHTLTIC